MRWPGDPGGTPQGPPRSAGGPSAGGFLVGVLAALWFSPVTLAVWLVSGYVIARQRRWHCTGSPSVPWS
jgi:hypothetical protein